MRDILLHNKPDKVRGPVLDCDLKRSHERDRALKLIIHVLAPPEMRRLEESGQLIQLRIPHRIDPSLLSPITAHSIEIAKKEYRLAFVQLAQAEESATTRDKRKCAHPKRLQGDQCALQKGQPLFKDTVHPVDCDSLPTRYDEKTKDGNFAQVKQNQLHTVVVCGVCLEVYRLLDHVRCILGEVEIEPKEVKDEKKDPTLTLPLVNKDLGPNISKKFLSPGENKYAPEGKNSLFKHNQQLRRTKEKAAAGKLAKGPKQGGIKHTPQQAPTKYQKIQQKSKQKATKRVNDSIQLKNKESNTGRSRKQNNILVVDHDESNAKEAQIILQSEGYDVDIATSEDEFANMIWMEAYNVILLANDLAHKGVSDVKKMIQDRHEKLCPITSQPEYPKIIVMLDDIGNGDLGSCRKSDMHGWVHKPLHGPKLIATVTEVAQLNPERTERAKNANSRSIIKNNADTCRTRNKKSQKNRTPKQKECEINRRTSASPAEIHQSVTSDVLAEKNPNTFSGVMEIDTQTKFPFAVIDSGNIFENEKSSGRRQKITKENTFFNLIVCHDIFDTFERFEILLRPIVTQYPGMQILLWNYPGQAFTTFPIKQTLNNAYHADCLKQLLRYVGSDDVQTFSAEKPYFILGYGSGSMTATFFASKFRPPNLRSIILVNGLSFVDPYYASVLHDCKNVFGCSPETRPDLPVYFYARFIFSQQYLNQTTAPLALNVYTAVHNPITLRGRIQLCHGALHHIDMRPMIEDIGPPIISIHGEQASLVRPLHSQCFISKRTACKTIHQALSGGIHKTALIMTKGGHELFQEKKESLVTLIEQLLTGYYEKRDFDESGQNGSAKRKSTIAAAFLENVGTRNNNSKGRFEDHFLDTLVANTGPDRVEERGENKSTLFSSWADNKKGLAKKGTAANFPQNERNKKRTKCTDQDISKNILLSGMMNPTNPSFERQGNVIYKTGKSMLYPDPEEYPEAKEYMSWRLRRNKKRLLMLEHAACVIQGAIRVFMAKTILCRAKREISANTIQRVIRGNNGRKIFLTRNRLVWATCFTQRAIRGHMGRCKSYNQRKMIELQIRLARIWRGVAARKVVEALIKQRNTGAILLQSIWRKFKAKVVTIAMKYTRHACILVQRIFRGHMGRRKAIKERERYLFGLSHSKGIELSRQMVAEHKIQATRLQSEISILNKEKQTTETQVDKLLEEISKFREGVKVLEKEMHELNKAERENSGTIKGNIQHELREQKIRLDQEFSVMLTRISDRKARLGKLEERLERIARSRQSKNEELKKLERKLVVLLEAQQSELAEIKRRQEKKEREIFEGKTDKNVSLGENLNARTPSDIEKRQAAQLIDSTETMMKFGFMSMSMTYFSSLNMVKAMKSVGAQDTVMAALAENSRMQDGSFTASESAKRVAFDMESNTELQLQSWSVGDVIRWLSKISLSQYCEAFQDGAVDGALLCELTDDDLINTLGVEHKLHRKKILFGIDQLKGITENKVFDSAQPKVDVQLMRQNLITNIDAKKSPSNEYIQWDKADKVLVDSNLNKMEPTLTKSMIPIPDLEDLYAWVKHQKVEKLKEALSYLPDEYFDEVNTKVQFVSEVGTAYTDQYERQILKINKPDEYGNTLLHLAAQNGSTRIAKILIQKGANPNHQNKQGQTPGHFAIAYQFYDLASWLFDAEGGKGNDMLTNLYGLGPYDGLNDDIDG